jgi:hypothetical protein
MPAAQADEPGDATDTLDIRGICGLRRHQQGKALLARHGASKRYRHTQQHMDQ